MSASVGVVFAIVGLFIFSAANRQPTVIEINEDEARALSTTPEPVATRSPSWWRSLMPGKKAARARTARTDPKAKRGESRPRIAPIVNKGRREVFSDPWTPERVLAFKKVAAEDARIAKQPVMKYERTAGDEAPPVMQRTIFVQTVPPGARVKVGEQLLGTTPIYRPAPGGETSLQVVVEKYGFKTLRKVVLINEQQSFRLEAVLEPDPAQQEELAKQQGRRGPRR